MQSVMREPIRSKAAWVGPELAQRSDWITPLSGEELDDIESARRHAESQGKRWGGFGRSDFPLTVMRPRLAAVADELINGYGFVVLRGLPVKRYSPDEIRTVYWGLASHLGAIVSQNSLGTVIEEITDLHPSNVTDRNLRSYVTAQGQPPHCDFTDVVALLCVNKAKEGGQSTITSLMAIYNRILEQHPEFLAVLQDHYYLDQRGEGPTGDPDETSPVPVPVFSAHGDRIRGWFHKRLIMQGADKRGVALSALHRDALEYVESLGKDPSLRFDMDLQPGDLQLLSNFRAMHYRSAFVDDAEYKRLMLRIWINLHEPEDLEPAYASWIRRGIPPQAWAIAGAPVAALGNRTR